MSRARIVRQSAGLSGRLLCGFIRLSYHVSDDTFGTKQCSGLEI
jgi:hypothetical protein